MTNEIDEDNIKSCLIYVITEGPDYVYGDPEENPMCTVLGRVSFDHGDTVEDYRFYLGNMDIAKQFVDSVNKAAEPLHMKFVDQEGRDQYDG